ncbi:MAG: MlaC/ttg2D family ABC transporter substrate-binding protein [Methylosarcina sp.]
MQNPIKQWAVLGLITLLAGFLSATQGLAENLQQPQQVIQGISDQLQNKLRDKSFSQDFARVTRFVNDVIEPHTDFNRISALVLGKHWKSATTGDRERFKIEFRSLLVRTYSRAFVEYNDWTIRYLPLNQPSGANKLIVKTEVLQPGLNPVDVNYRMFLSQGKWKVYDIMIEGVSLVTNYRSSFSEEIQRKGSLSALIDSLAKRNSEALKAKES